jgi:hypothetical protein
MTMEEAVIQARQVLGRLASDDAVAELATSLYLDAAPPAELERLTLAGVHMEAFEVLLEHAHELTDEQIEALELTEDEAARMAHARQQ